MVEPRGLRIGITGASGYIGRSLVSCAAARGHEVVAIGRRAPCDGMQLRHADLSQDLPEGLLAGLDAVVHLASDTSGAPDTMHHEHRFARQLAAEASALGVVLLVVSSQASSPHAPSAYGRAKARIEQAVLPQGAIVVRPGMVFGGALLGLFGKLVQSVRRLPLLPDLRPRPLVQPIHVGDLCAAMLVALERPGAFHGRILAIAGEPVGFGTFLASIARQRLRTPRILVPVPAAILRRALAILDWLPGQAFSADRLDSLMELQVMDTRRDLQELGIRLRSLPDGLTPSGKATRRLLQEGRVLMEAFLGRPPSPWATRRYAAVIIARGNDRALPLPDVLLRFPSLIAALDNREFRVTAHSRRDGLAWRYAVAIRVLETRTEAASDFLVRAGRRDLTRLFVDAFRGGNRWLQAVLLAPLARRMARDHT